jgi:hypothetical protein
MKDLLLGVEVLAYVQAGTIDPIAHPDLTGISPPGRDAAVRVCRFPASPYDDLV